MVDTPGAPRRLPPIAEAGQARRAGLIATLAAAFVDDPALAWIIPERGDRIARLPRLFARLVDEELAAGWVLASPDDEAVTLWRHSEAVHGSLWALVRSVPGYLAALGPALPRALRVSLAIEAHHPAGLLYDYLHYAAVAPAMQGRGLGGAAIRAGCDRARATGRPVYLETATPENVGLYQRLGFAIEREWDVGGGGPHFWSMLWRG